MFQLLHRQRRGLALQRVEVHGEALRERAADGGVDAGLVGLDDGGGARAEREARAIRLGHAHGGVGGGERDGVADGVLRDLRAEAAGLLQQREEQRQELGRERELAVGGLPAGRENVERAFADGHLQQRGVAGVELRDDARAGELRRVQSPILPEVNLGEVAEARVGERREERVLEINLREHRVGRHLCLVSGDGFLAEQSGQRPRDVPILERDENGFAVGQQAADGGGAFVGQGVRDDDKRSVGIGG